MKIQQNVRKNSKIMLLLKTFNSRTKIESLNWDIFLSQDSGLSEVTGQLRTMNIAAAAAAADSHAAEHAHHGATPYMIPRHYQPVSEGFSNKK